MPSSEWQVVNPKAKKRVIVTKQLPGDRWLQILTDADCRVEICPSTEVVSTDEILEAIGDRCDAAIGQLTETWGEALFSALKAAGAAAYNPRQEALEKKGVSVKVVGDAVTPAKAFDAVHQGFAAGRSI